MVLVTQRRRHPSRMMLLVLIISFVLVRHCEPMSTKRLTDPSFSSPTLTRNSGESRSQLGSPSELAWQAWLLVDSQTGGGGAHSGMDSATFLRRITPKSVFIAPALPALPPCADGYRADAMGRCVKTVNINHEAHFGFLLQRLNNRYANRGNYGAYNSQKKTTGPLQLNIPLLSDTDTNSFHGDQDKAKESTKGPAPTNQDVGPKAEKHLLESLAAAMYQKCNINRKENESSFTREDTGNAPVVKDNRRVSSEGREPFEAIVRIYQPKNSTGVEESESGFSYNDSSTVASNDDRQVSKRPLEITVTRYQANNNNSEVEGESTFFGEVAGAPASEEGQPSKKSKESVEIVGYQSKNNIKGVESETDSFDDNSTASSNVQETSGEEDLPPEIADVYDARNNDTEEEHTFFDEEEDTTVIPDEEALKRQPLEIMVPNSKNNSKKEAREEEGIREEEEENTSSYFDEVTSTISSENDYERFYNEDKESPDYQTRNDSRNDESEEPNFSYENTSTVTSDKDDEGTTSRLDDDAVPVADFVDDANDTSFSDVVDYKIPLDLRTLLNMPSVRTLNSSDDHDLWWDE